MGHAAFGRYHLIAELGHGGMADVFLAVQAGPAGSRFRKLSVIKRLRQNLAEDPEFIAMLLEEARIASRLNHPNVVQTNEVSAVDDQYYIAMEYLDGQPLHRIQHRLLSRARSAGKKRLDPEATDALVVALMDALAGLHHAHDLLDYDGESLSIVHRDVTPQNIFITYAGQVKVVDFGVAKAAGRAAETRQGVVKGKVRYMAPEHAAGLQIDRRADVFAVGVLLWEQLTGQRMWRDMDDLVIVQHLVNRTMPRSPRDIDPTVCPALSEICVRALAPRADDRYPSADAMRLDLEEALAKSGRLISARRALAPLVQSTFEDKRAEMKRIIEQQLAELENVGSGEFVPMRLGASNNSMTSLTPAPPGTSSTSGGTALMTPGAFGIPRPRTTSSGPPLGSLPDPGALPDFVSGERAAASSGPSSVPAGVTSRRSGAPPSRFGRSSLLALSVFTCASIALLAGVLLTRDRWSPRAASAAAPQSTAAGIEHVIVRLDASPKNAKISIDQGPAEDVPLSLTVVKDSREHQIRVEAPGHEPKLQTIRFTNDLTAFIALEKKNAPATGSPVVTPAQAAAPSQPATVVGRKGTTGSGPAGEPGTEPPKPSAPPATTGTTAAAGTSEMGGSGRPPKFERLNTKLDKNDPWKE